MTGIPDNAGTCPVCGYVQNKLPDNPLFLFPGNIINKRYLLGRVLGFGGFGITYIGYDGVLQRTVAIKEFFPSGLVSRQTGNPYVTVYSGEAGEIYTANLESFHDEAIRLAKLHDIHGVVHIYDCVRANGTAYIIMEYLEGESYKDILKRVNRLSVEEATGIILRILNTLHDIHQQGIIHRDIAPDNIFRKKNGDIVLIDFGAARQVSAFTQVDLTVLLKRGYAPEEQYSPDGGQGPWTDIYGVGATFYRMITGVRPADSIDRLRGIPLDPPSRMGIAIPRHIERAIMKSLSINAADRYQTAYDFMQDLMEVPGTEPVPGDRGHRKTDGRKPGESKAPLIAACALGAAAVIAGAVFLLPRVGEWLPRRTDTSAVTAEAGSTSGSQTSAVGAEAGSAPGSQASAGNAEAGSAPGSETSAGSAEADSSSGGQASTGDSESDSASESSSSGSGAKKAKTGSEAKNAETDSEAKDTQSADSTKDKKPGSESSDPANEQSASLDNAATKDPGQALHIWESGWTEDDIVNASDLRPGNDSLGLVVYLGEMEQDGDSSNGEERIQWIATDYIDYYDRETSELAENMLVLTSRFALATQAPAFTSAANPSWLTSDLRKWLNDDFFTSVFTKEEQAHIPFTQHDEESSGLLRYPERPESEDQVYIPSLHELYYPFNFDHYIRFKATASAAAQGLSTDKEGYCGVLLRNYNSEEQWFSYTLNPDFENHNGVVPVIGYYTGKTYQDEATIKKVQQRLNDLGYNCGAVDGDLGSMTRAIIKEIQVLYGLCPCGMITDPLLKALEL